MENQRVRLTKTLLANALMKLLHTKPLDRITVYELCSEAGINRSTFYKYYGSVYALLESLEARILGELESRLEGDGGSSLQSLTRVLEVLLADRDNFMTILNADPNLIKKTFNLPIIHDLLRTTFPEGTPEWKKPYLTAFVCEGGYAIVRKWLSDPDPRPAADIAVLIYETLYS